MRDKNLYHNLRATDKIARHDDSEFEREGSLIVLDPERIEHLTTQRPSPFVDQSAFFRTHANNPLSPELRRELRKNLIRLTLSENARSCLAELPFQEGKASTQGWGIRTILEHLMPIICGSRDVELRELTKEYVERVIISSNVKGIRKARQAQVSAGIWKRMEPLLQPLRPTSENPVDLVDVALSISGSLTLRELPEVYARLVLSMVGFTGIALEWAVVMAAGKNPDGGKWIDSEPSINIIQECQRIAPTAWKLIREVDPAGDGSSLKTVIIMTSTVHRSERLWPSALRFDPRRWNQHKPTPTEYFPFGKHDMICPARQFALDYLTSALDSLRDGFNIKVKPTLHLPRAHILFVPAYRTFALERKVA